MRAATVIAVALMAGGGAVSSQAPELAQQYRQRLQGALEELRAVVANFDADASRNALDRDAALDVYDRSSERFLNDRGESMREVIARYEHLERQSERLDELPRALRPLVMITDPDGAVFRGAVRDFEPGVPLTTHGAIWTAAGAGLALFLFRSTRLFFHRRRSKPTRRNFA